MFKVRRKTNVWSPGQVGRVEHDDSWSVFIPWQSGPVSIVGDEQSGEPHEQAVAELESFIAEAQLALDALKNRREID